MADEKWQKVRVIFDSALKREPEARYEFVAKACGDDKALLEELESLLSSLGHVENFMEKPAVAEIVDVFENPTIQIEAGKCFGHYEIIKKIGAGGMGEVYLASDKKLDRRVAVKILNDKFSRDESNLSRFIQEAKAASGLNHPNILVIHEIGESEDAHYIVSEFIEGKTLREVLRKSPLQLTEVLDISIQIVNALTAAHGAHLVHRDIKPENIMIRPDGYVKILDFGLAKLLEDKKRSFIGFEADTVKQHQTAQGMILGTVSYMSPEQAKAEQVDERTDVFSLGVVIYELIAGRTPFASDSMSETFANVINKEPSPLSRFATNVPPELQRIVSKMLQKNRELRYQTTKDLALDLRHLRQRLDVEAEIERITEPQEKLFDGKGPATDGTKHKTEIVRDGVETGGASVANSSSSASSLYETITRNKRGATIALAVFVALATLAGYFAYTRNAVKSGSPNIDSTLKIRSVAVLPFSNATGSPDTEYLSDGVSESLINSISQLPGIKVIARSSSFKYKGKEVDPQEVAKALSVDAILTGRVTQVADNIIISVELVDARDRTQIWGRQFNRKFADLLAVQSEISSEIAQNLRLQLTAGAQQQLAKRETENPQAYELLLKGRYSRSKGGTENRKKAINYFQQAIAIDPAYALAYVELSASYGGLVNSNILDPKEFTPKAEAAARKALELDDNLAEAHLAMSNVKMDAWDWAGAEREIKRALELNPNLARAHAEYAVYLRIQGRIDESVAEHNRVRELDPLSLSANQAALIVLQITRQDDKALELAKKILELDKSNPEWHLRVGILYARLRRYREAIAQFLEAIKLGDDSPDAQTYLGESYAKAGERDKARVILEQLKTGKAYVSPVALAMVHDALGERDPAFALLETAYEAHDQQLIWLRSPDFDDMRSDPRFSDLMRRVGLTP